MSSYVLALDLGGTNSEIGLVDRQGHIFNRMSLSTADYRTVDTYIDAFYKSAVHLTEPYGGLRSVKAIGAGVPNGNIYTGNIEHAMNLPWHEQIPFAELVAGRFQIPCKITNDANAAALGEMEFGAARGMKNFIELTLGTGLGSGIVINGQVVYGHDGLAGELGHVCANAASNARRCNCGKRGCLETYVSATGVVRTAKEILTKTNKPSLLRTIDHLTSYDVYSAAEQGDEVAKEIWLYTGRLLGRKIADFVSFSSPEAVVLFGGLTNAGKWLLEPTEESLNKNLLPIWRRKIKVTVSGLDGADAAILGAAALAWQI
ncbi:MAG: ROK family protein [Paludibacteraceae bacterium]|nr:ROK family protein [Paludibacteraceae bacterium]